MQWLLLQINIFLLKSDIRKHIDVSVNKEQINKSSSKKYSTGFSFLQNLLLAADKKY